MSNRGKECSRLAVAVTILKYEQRRSQDLQKHLKGLFLP